MGATPIDSPGGKLLSGEAAWMEGNWGRVDERALRRQEKPKRGTNYRAPTGRIAEAKWQTGSTCCTSDGRVRQGFLFQAEDDAAVYLAFFEPAEDIVDGFKRQGIDGGFHLAFGRKGERFFEVESRADDGTANGVAVQNQLENRNGKLAGRQAIQHASSAPAQHPDGLLEGDR